MLPILSLQRCPERLSTVLEKPALRTSTQVHMVQAISVCSLAHDWMPYERCGLHSAVNNTARHSKHPAAGSGLVSCVHWNDQHPKHACSNITQQMKKLVHSNAGAHPSYVCCPFSSSLFLAQGQAEDSSACESCPCP